VKWCVEHSTAARDGEAENGDAVIVREVGDGILFAVIDALGHGPRAAQVAQAAVEELGKVAVTGNVLTLIEQVHACLRGTRGAAALVCKLTSDRLDACGIGNVEMRCSLPRMPIVMTPGVLGVHTKVPRVFGGPVREGTRIIVHTDGISSRFEMSSLRALSPREAASKILLSFRHPHDDATVLVADFGSFAHA
jgi:negative regulator of sigma-B (phosphoserine phosphatase)